jgi:hypothetical protein
MPTPLAGIQANRQNENELAQLNSIETTIIGQATQKSKRPMAVFEADEAKPNRDQRERLLGAVLGETTPCGCGSVAEAAGPRRREALVSTASGTA